MVEVGGIDGLALQASGGPPSPGTVPSGGRVSPSAGAPCQWPAPGQLVHHLLAALAGDGSDVPLAVGPIAHHAGAFPPDGHRPISALRRKSGGLACQGAPWRYRPAMGCSLSTPGGGRGTPNGTPSRGGMAAAAGRGVPRERRVLILHYTPSAAEERLSAAGGLPREGAAEMPRRPW